MVIRFFKNTKEYEKIISIGGGTATDIGKYLSYKFKKDLICIPTMLSTNAYSTNKVALKVNNKIETLDAVLPVEILLDIKKFFVTLNFERPKQKAYNQKD